MMFFAPYAFLLNLSTLPAYLEVEDEYLTGTLADVMAQPENTVLPGGVGQLLLAVFIFVAVIYILYLFYKHFLPGGRRGVGFGKSKHMRVLEITSVGPGSTIQLVKVSEEYFLIGVTKSHITFLAKADADSIGSVFEADNNEITSDQRPVFGSLLGRIIKLDKRSDIGSDKDEEN